MNDESLREQHERLLRIATPCDQLAVCQDREPRCAGCKQSEGRESVNRLLAELGKRPNLPLDQGVK